MSNYYSELYRATKEHSGMDDLQIVQAGERGADTGWPGFTYTRDTVAFYTQHHRTIWQLLRNVADELGEEHPLAMIAEFNGAAEVDDHDSFANLLAWFTLEEVGRWLADHPQPADAD